MDILIENIKGLVLVTSDPVTWVAGSSMSDLPVISQAYLLIRSGLIHDYGPMKEMPDRTVDQRINAHGSFVFPSFVDSHSHLVFAGSRENEFVDKIKGLSYSDIAKKGGGILNSAKKLQNTSEEELYDQALERLYEVIGLGTGAIEIKSGYGLTTKDEIKMLRVARKLKETTPVSIKSTFLGAHAIPADCTREEYIHKVVEEMIPQVAQEGLADYCDVFCEEGFFTPQESLRILGQGLKYGLKPKVHANQLHQSGGVQVGVETGAISVDHLECMGNEEIQCLKGTATMPTLLPGAAFYLNMNYPPARQLIAAGLPVALATDYNPGSAPSGNMPLVLSLACIKMKMTPEEAIVAATINGAYAMELEGSLGSITRGKLANVFITRPMPSYSFLPYAFGSSLIQTTILNGQVV